MQRRKWAKPYLGENTTESSIVVDIEHNGFTDQDVSEDLRK
jgi:phosphoketolase